MIRVEHLTKTYGKIRALEDISFHIAEGELVGLIGPNGAGKTTTLRCLTGLTLPDHGDAWLGGSHVGRETAAIRRQIGFLPEGTPLSEELTVREYLKFRGRLKIRGRGPVPGTPEACMALCDLEGVAHRVIRNLSAGYRKRVGLAEALLGDPKILFFDEPTNGLDPEQTVRMRQLLLSMKSGRTVVVSSHILSELDLICDRFLIIAGGRLRSSGTRRELLKNSRKPLQIRLETSGGSDGLIRNLEDTGWKVTVQECGAPFACTLEAALGGADPLPLINRIAREHGVDILKLLPMEPDLENLYLEMVRDADTAHPAE